MSLPTKTHVSTLIIYPKPVGPFQVSWKGHSPIRASSSPMRHATTMLYIHPRHSMYAIYAYIDPQNHPNVRMHIYIYILYIYIYTAGVSGHVLPPFFRKYVQPLLTGGVSPTVIFRPIGRSEDGGLGSTLREGDLRRVRRFNSPGRRRAWTPAMEVFDPAPAKRTCWYQTHWY